MMGISEQLQVHIESGCTTLCRAWAVYRKDGEVFGFTDHDCDFQFAGVNFRADSGLTAYSLQKSTGLSVDNTEALGAISDACLRDDDIAAGLFDDAEVKTWIVNWSDPSQRDLIFRGHIGDITCVDGLFRAELRGLADRLNQPLGRTIQKTCGAVLGDGRCGFDTSLPNYQVQTTIASIEDRTSFVTSDIGVFVEKWFQNGVCGVLSGAAKGENAVIKNDEQRGNGRRIELWAPPQVPLEIGEKIQLIAGCDKSFTMCREKFKNGYNFRGFPDVPEDEWIVSHAASMRHRGGGSRR